MFPFSKKLHIPNVPRTVGGAQDSPHATNTRFMMKNGAQQMMKAEKTTPRTLLAFSSETEPLPSVSLVTLF